MQFKCKPLREGKGPLSGTQFVITPLLHQWPLLDWAAPYDRFCTLKVRVSENFLPKISKNDKNGAKSFKFWYLVFRFPVFLILKNCFDNNGVKITKFGILETANFLLDPLSKEERHYSDDPPRLRFCPVQTLGIASFGS